MKKLFWLPSLVLTLGLAGCGTQPLPEPSFSSQAVSSTTTVNRPPTGTVSWDWQLNATDAQIKVPAGVKLMDVDGFETSASKVAQLKASGVYTVCYINVGSYEPYRPDSAQYPDYLKLKADPDWPGEAFVDVNDVWKPNSVLASILRNRFKMCKDKGFDALEPDNLQNDENTGGAITTQQQIDFNGWVADEAHAAGLAVFQKNGPDKILLRDKLGRRMVDVFDGILNESCQQYAECNPLTEYVKRGKLALNVEYSVSPNCTLSKSLNINTMRRDLGLVAPGMSGYRRVSCQ